jgi:hypothetical protein
LGYRYTAAAAMARLVPFPRGVLSIGNCSPHDATPGANLLLRLKTVRFVRAMLYANTSLMYAQPTTCNSAPPSAVTALLHHVVGCAYMHALVEAEQNILS